MTNKKISNNLLPEGWTLVELGKIFKTTSGGTPSRKNPTYFEGDIPWVKSGELENNIIFDTEEKISQEALSSSSAKLFPKGTLLIALYGATIGKLAFLGIDATTNQAICGIFDNGVINLKYIFYFLLFKRPELIRVGTGGAQPNISQEIIRKLIIPVSPLLEQRAIVAKIEQLFSELDNGIASLKKAQEQLKGYRQSVLKWAFEGKLTEKWREENRDNLISGQELIEQIRDERQKRFKSKIEDENNKQIKYSQTIKDIPTLSENLINELPKLPTGWGWARIGEISICLDRYRIPINKEERKNRNGSIPYYGANGQVGWIDDYIFDDELVLVVEDETFIGREIPFAYKIKGKSWVNNHAHVLKNESLINIDFLMYALMYYPFIPLTTGTTGRRKLTQDALLKAPIRICNLEEQRQIVQEIETRLSIIENLEETISDNLQKSKSLRQSILKKAFEGKLLSESELEAGRQDPEWESAERLLERIKRL